MTEQDLLKLIRNDIAALNDMLAESLQRTREDKLSTQIKFPDREQPFGADLPPLRRTRRTAKETRGTAVT